MPISEAPARSKRRRVRERPYPAVKARGGEIILDTSAKRVIFVAGLAGAIALALLFGLLALTG